MTKQVLVTGATGFVGRHVAAALQARGVDVRASSRDPWRARRDQPQYRWVEADLQREDTLRRALAGCDAAIFLVHSIGEPNYAQREAAGAESFARAAAAAGVKRIIYLGGVMPDDADSTHLASRSRTGEILRAGPVPTLELRAGMVIGKGSASWQIVSRLAERLPVIPLPTWLARHSWPIGIRDVVRAIVAALTLPDEGHGCYELPGPERVSHRQLMERTARSLGEARAVLEIPFVPPWLTAGGVALLSGVDHSLVRELLQGIRVDLDPTGPSFWTRIGDAPRALDRAIEEALEPRGSIGEQWLELLASPVFQWISGEHTKPQRSSDAAWVAQATPEWSRAHVDDHPSAVRGLLLAQLNVIAGPLPPLRYATAHRWRYARTRTPLGAPYVLDEGLRLSACGDWCLGDRLEDAFVSGLALARRVVELVQRRSAS